MKETKIFYGELQPYFQDALHVRKIVFNREQGYDATIDHDSMDKYAWHIVCYDDDKEIATARLYKNIVDGAYGIGRVAVLKAYRKQNLGLYMMEQLLKKAVELGEYRTLILHSQTHAIPFYSRLGFEIDGEEYLEEGKPHISMKKILRTRGFEVAKGFENLSPVIPVRQTVASAGYDLSLVENVIIPPRTTKLAKTGLKAYMQNDEVLELHIRSSVAVKQNVWCANNVGIVDADYYSNPDNDGHIMVPLYNANDTAIEFKVGDRVAQAIFKKYLTIDGEAEELFETRVGGFGSTGKKN